MQLLGDLFQEVVLVGSILFNLRIQPQLQDGLDSQAVKLGGVFTGGKAKSAGTIKLSALELAFGSRKAAQITGVSRTLENDGSLVSIGVGQSERGEKKN